jgi:hypothetical protein
MLLMTYDLVQNGDNQLNTEIKEALINRGWSDCALYRVKPSNRVMEDSTPSTTLWKQGDNQKEGCSDFAIVCTRYNIQHLEEKRRAIGKVVCVNYKDDCCVKLE